MRIKVAAVQCRVGANNSFDSAEKLIAEGVEKGIELFVLPEYFSYRKGDDLFETSHATIRKLSEWSKEYSCVVAGNVVVRAGEKLFNAAHVFVGGELIGIQEKIHPTRTERSLGIGCGDEIKVFDVNGIKISVLICADILYPEACRIAALKGADVVLNPVVSFKHSELPAQRMRNCLYFARSFDNAYAVVKAGGPGFTFLGSETAGRSLISTFEGIAASYTDEKAEELVSAELDISSIRKYRQINYSLHDRNVRAYSELLDHGFDCE